MSFSVVDEASEEVLVTRIMIINRHPEPVGVLPKYRCLFHGKEVIPYGKFVVRYPVTNIWYQRLLSSFVRDYPGLQVFVGASGIERL
jgi:hypothetical protein